MTRGMMIRRYGCGRWLPARKWLRFNGHRAGVYSVSFLPDSRRVASAGSDAIAIVWDLALEANGQAAQVTPAELESLWSELGKDAARAYRAIWRMSAAPDQVVPLLAERLQPVRPDDPDRDTSLGPIATGETLRRLRAIAALEKINNPASRRLLERMATGLQGAPRDPRCPGGPAADGRMSNCHRLSRSSKKPRKTPRPVAVHDAEQDADERAGADAFPRVSGGHRSSAQVGKDEQQSDRELDHRVAWRVGRSACAALAAQEHPPQHGYVIASEDRGAASRTARSRTQVGSTPLGIR